MGREVRKVPEFWYHPKRYSGERKDYFYVPLYDGYNRRRADWERELQEINRRKAEALVIGSDPRILADVDKEQTEHLRARPNPCLYMPDFPPELRTHYQMYEDTSEGTPISPAFVRPEDLAHWLADNKASAFAGMTATYEQWLAMITGPGSSVCQVSIGGGPCISGVAAGV